MANQRYVTHRPLSAPASCFRRPKTLSLTPSLRASSEIL